MFVNNKKFYEDVKRKNYPIKKIAGHMEKTQDNIIKFLAFSFLGDPWEVIQLLNSYFPKWRETF